MHSALEFQLRDLLGLTGEHELAAFLQSLGEVANGGTVSPKHATALRGVKAMLDAVATRYEQSDRDLKASQTRFRELIETLSDWYWEQDAQHRFTRISRGVMEITGRDESSFIGKTRCEAFGGDPRAPEWIEHQRILDAHLPFSEFEFSYPGRDGNRVYVSASGGPVFDEHHRFVGYRGIARNITQRKQAETQLHESARFTETLLDSLPNPVTVKNRAHRFLRINAAHIRTFGTERDALLGKTAVETVGEVARGVHDVEDELIANPGVRLFNQTRPVQGGGDRHFVVTKATVCDEKGEVTGFITTHVDVTELREAEARVEEQLRFTNVILETSPTPMMVKDARRKITYINAAYEKLFGVCREDVVNREMRLQLSSGAISDIERLELKLLESPGSRQFEYVLPGAGGREVHCVITKSTYLNGDGVVSGIVTTYSDVTEFKNVERAAAEQLRLTSVLLEASPAPTVVKDRNLQLIICNSAYEKQFEVRREDILNKPLSAHRSELAAEVEKQERRMLVEGGTHQIERAIVAPSGRRIDCIVTKSTYSNVVGEVSGIITTFTDISELKRTEQNLIAAKHAAETAMRTRSQFLANMSHEIRTPMNGVLGMSSLLYTTPLNSEQREYLDTLKLSGEALLKIINDILDFSKIEAGKVEIERTSFDVRSRVSAIAQLFAASARERNLRVTSDIAADVPPVVVGDPVRIGQVLSIIVANAIKFTVEGSVHLAVSVASRQGNSFFLRFDVTDTGIGIPEEAIERIFQPFSQADAGTTRRFGGTGLGLTISRELVELMGGELWVKSTPGKGSQFGFTVEVTIGDAWAGEEAAPAGAPTQPRQAASRATTVATEVLLAEDNVVNQVVATRMLERLGCNVTLAVDGAKAVELASQRAFDVILMDCHMPNMDGFAATAAIRAMEKTDAGGTRRVIVAQTANAMEGDRETCLAASMDDYITKPYTLETLEGVLKRWVRGRV
mgnify:CR=1 FL=1